MAGLSRTARFYRDNPEARKRHNDYQKAKNKEPREKKRRVELNRVNRKRLREGTASKGDGMDNAHVGNGKRTVLKRQSVNRGSKSDQAGDRRARGRKRRK